MPRSTLESEILQQPEVISTLLSDERDNVREMVKEIRGKFNYVLIAARGTSDNAARYAQYLLGAHNHIQVALATPSLFSIYQSAPDLTGALVLGISQSGQSPDIVSVLAEANRQDRPTIAITNDTQSPLAQASQYAIPLHASPEKAVAATKSYTSSLAALALLSCCLEDSTPRFEDLQRVPEVMRHTITLLQESLRRVERYRYMNQCSVIGRGYNYATAFEIALKIKELTRVVAEPYSSADFRHGPIATVSRSFPVILVSPKGQVHSDMLDLVTRLKTLEAELLVISEDEKMLEKAHFPLPIAAGVPEWLSPLVAVLPGQLFAMHLTMAKGLNVDQPEGLTKVTETL
jgi:glucosamine--fructose-6-phosphate aminotransferase (isomerizing)